MYMYKPTNHPTGMRCCKRDNDFFSDELFSTTLIYLPTHTQLHVTSVI
jgi:hypothetical protein